MQHNFLVYSHLADPRVDKPLYRISRADAFERMDKGYARPVGPLAIQLKPPPDYVPDTKNSGIFGEVWQPRYSANFLVMQMCPTLSDLPQSQTQKIVPARFLPGRQSDI